MTRKNAVVTGGLGFIGSHLVEHLIEQGYFVHIIDDFSNGRLENVINFVPKENIQIHEHDIRDDVNLIQRRIQVDIDYIFHLAGKGDIVPSIDNPLEYFKTNVIGTVNCLELARSWKVKKFVYAASSSCYGLAPTPTDERCPLSPQYPYALSKLQGEQAALHWAQVYSVPIASIRIFNAYGPRVMTRGTYGAMFGVFIKQMLEQKPLTIVGDGSQERDFVYVSDVARAFRLVAENENALGVFNVGKGKSDKVIDIAKLISSDLQFIPKRPGEPTITLADITRITTIVGWKPEVGIEEGVNKLLENSDDWRKAPLWDASSIEVATANWFKYLKNQHNR